MGLVAVRGLLLLLPLLAGCSVVPALAGLAAGGASGGVTANPVIGYAVGISVEAGADALQRYIDRKRQQGEQDAIAEAAGQAPLGESRDWAIHHTIPIGNESGTLTPVRDIDTPLASCREILFTVKGDGIFTTSVCRQAEGWKWAAAEPAISRWGFLQ